MHALADAETPARLIYEAAGGAHFYKGKISLHDGRRLVVANYVEWV